MRHESARKKLINIQPNTINSVSSLPPLKSPCEKYGLNILNSRILTLSPINISKSQFVIPKENNIKEELDHLLAEKTIVKDTYKRKNTKLKIPKKFTLSNTEHKPEDLEKSCILRFHGNFTAARKALLLTEFEPETIEYKLETLLNKSIIEDLIDNKTHEVPKKPDLFWLYNKENEGQLISDLKTMLTDSNNPNKGSDLLKPTKIQSISLEIYKCIKNLINEIISDNSNKGILLMKAFDFLIKATEQKFATILEECIGINKRLINDSIEINPNMNFTLITETTDNNASYANTIKRLTKQINGLQEKLLNNEKNIELYKSELNKWVLSYDKLKNSKKILTTTCNYNEITVSNTYLYFYKLDYQKKRKLFR